MVFDKNCVTPLYVQLKAELMNRINNGILKSGEQLPPELEMADNFSVSVVTVRSAVNELVKEGLIEKKRGKGTFVSNTKYKRDYTKIQSFSDSCRAMGSIPGSRVLEMKLEKADNSLAQKLGVNSGDNVLYISRLRTVNGEPMVIEKNYFPERFAELLNEDLEANSLFGILQEKYGITVTKSSKEVEIARTTSEEGKLLNLTKNYPILLVKSVAYDQFDTPVYVGSQAINGERFTLKI
jgi:GntR family transcriptional regulator